MFPSRVSTFTLDEESSRRRGSSPDEVVKIGYGEIEPEDIELLKDNLNLSDVAASAAFNLKQMFGANWLGEFLQRGGADLGELAEDLGVNRAALGRCTTASPASSAFPSWRMATAIMPPPASSSTWNGASMWFWSLAGTGET